MDYSFEIQTILGFPQYRVVILDGTDVQQLAIFGTTCIQPQCMFGVRW